MAAQIEQPLRNPAASTATRLDFAGADAGLLDTWVDRRRASRDGLSKSGRTADGTRRQGPDRRAAPSCRVVTTDAGFDALRKPWTDLHGRIRGTVFQSFEWQRTWWKHCGGANHDRSLRIVVFSRGPEVVAIAPLMIETERVLGVVPVKILRFIATGVSDYLGVLCEPRATNAVAGAFVQVLADLGAEIVSLRDLASGAEFCLRLTDLLKAGQWVVDDIASERCPRTQLAATWAGTLAAFPRSVRKRMTNTLNRVERDFEVEYSVIERQDEFSEVFAWLTTAHQAQWQKRGHGGVFKHPQEAAFLQQVARELLPAGWLYLAQLKLNGRRVAVEYGFQVGDSLQVYQGAMDCPKEWERYSPGTVIHLLGMKAMIARGVRIYDFLRGAEPYKYHLGAVDDCTWHLQFFRRDSFVVVRWKLRLWQLQKAARQWLGNTLVALQSRSRNGDSDPDTDGARRGD
ncbi:MAG: GNAT family N-acetyltransferase [Steroidobacteraceae bacterium]